MRFIIDFLKEHRSTILIYIVTVIIFDLLGLLYHIENMDMILYAFILSLALFLTIGAMQLGKYIKRREKIELVLQNYEKDRTLKLDGIQFAQGDRFITTVGMTEREALLEILVRMHDLGERDNNAAQQKTQDAKDYYLMWAHQIKTPIAAMKLLLEDEDISQNGFRLKEELIKVEQYVEMGLGYQRIESMESDLDLQEYSCKDMIRQVVKKNSLLFINKGLRLEMPKEDYTIITDEKWFCFCLGQLLSNSIKYTRTGSIVFRLSRTENDTVIFLQDTGIGIRPEDIPRICEKGFTGYNGRLDKKATGIGLYICKQVFTHLGITMEVESVMGEGTTVKLICPLQNQKPQD